MSSVRETDLSQLFGRWNELVRAGQVVSVEELCEEAGFVNQPDLAVELSKRIELARSVSQFAADASGNQFETVDYHMQSDDTQSDAVKLDPKQPIVERSADSTWASDLTTTWQSPSKRLPADEGEVPVSTDGDMVSFSRFNSLRLIARGGLGEIFRASEVVFGREVAIKFIRPDCAQKKSHTQVFKTEAEITARLEHPGVVPIYAIGADSGGRPFYVMRLVRGQTLDDQIKDFHEEADGSDLERGKHSIAYRKLLAQFVSVCNTIGYAHRRGVLHRDIKPQNIMLGKYGETLVVDWGLARSIERDDSDRSSGEETLMPNTDDNDVEFAQGIVGTPNYMSPEQADGSLAVGKPTDIYSLGATLYKILTGEMAICSDSIGSTLARVRQGDFSPPHQRNANVPDALSAICCQAMAVNPLNRYATAIDLAADIERYLADEPVTAMRESLACRTQRWLRQHSVFVKVATTAAVVALLAFAVVSNIRSQQDQLRVEGHREQLEHEAFATEQRLQNAINNLRSDVRFLAKQPTVVASLEKADAADVAQELTNALFADFITDQPSYMQARLIKSDGWEVVRQERTLADGPVSSAETMQNKSGRDYVEEPLQYRQEEKDRIYISELNLNQDKGQKNKDYPVVRVAAPVFSTTESDSQEEASPLGVAVINLHFGALADKMNSARSDVTESSNRLIYLTNSEGQFLLHPTDGIAFRFEADGEKLDYRINEIYPHLATVLDSQDATKRSWFLPAVTPKPGILIEHSGGKSMRGLVQQVMQEFSGIQRKYNKDATRAILTGVRTEQLEAVKAFIQQVDSNASVQLLPKDSAFGEQAVYCRKIFLNFDDSGNAGLSGSENTYYLILSQPYE